MIIKLEEDHNNSTWTAKARLTNMTWKNLWDKINLWKYEKLCSFFDDKANKWKVEIVKLIYDLIWYGRDEKYLRMDDNYHPDKRSMDKCPLESCHLIKIILAAATWYCKNVHQNDNVH